MAKVNRDEKPVATLIVDVKGPADATFGTSITISGRLVREQDQMGIAGREVTLVGPDQLVAKTKNKGMVEFNVELSKVDVGKQDFEINFAGDDDYAPSSDGGTFNIAAADLRVTGATAADREYDGTANAAINLENAQLVGRVQGTDVDLETKGASASFNDKKAGSDKNVTVTGLTLVGADANKYNLKDVIVTASITQAPLTVEGIKALNKPADGKINAEFDPSGAKLVGVLGNDDVTLDTTGAQAAFDDPNPGTNKVVTISGLALTGTDADNYSVDPVTTQANITPASPAVTRTQPGNNLRAGFKRVLRDSSVNANVAQLIRGVSDPGGKVDPNLVKNAFSSIASAFEGSDAVTAKGEPCKGQLRLEFFVNEAGSNPKPIDARRLSNLAIQLIDDDFNIASSTRGFEKNAILFTEVEARDDIRVAFGSDTVAYGDISDDYEVATPGQKFQKFRRTHLKRMQGLPAPGGRTVAQPGTGFQARVAAGLQTVIKFFIDPPKATVRCYSRLVGDDCCADSNQSIQSVAVTAMQGEKSVQCNPTRPTGEACFTLPGGWYSFSTPQEITIEGCNYELCSSSPISAYLGAGQTCSDIYFSYRKKGGEIVVDAEIIHPEANDPGGTVTENLPGMSYLLLRQSDSSFVHQQSSPDGFAVHFRGLAAGTYLLFCQAPSEFDSKPVTPVFPANARMAIQVFAGQTGPVPVLVKFRSTIVAPAVIDGYVRDDIGQIIPQQLVKVLNSAGVLAAAGVTDATGLYSIQIYTAEDLTIWVGAQQATIAKSEIQAAMKQVGKPAVPFAGNVIRRLEQESELVGFGN